MTELTNPENKPVKWVDGQVIMQLLYISKDTLSSYREKGFLVYSTIGGKYLYDLQSALDRLEKNKKGGDR